jgi:antitoxin Phd
MAKTPKDRAARRTATRAMQRTAPGAVRATDAKNQFGRLLDKALRGERVVITKHEAPAAVLMSFDEFRMLVMDAGPDLDALSEEFDEMLERMQAPGARKASDALLRASPETLGRGAVTTARKKARSRSRA